MSWQDRDEYLKEIIDQVKFFFDHESIEKELTVHLEERKEDYISEGYTEKKAEELTLTNFGDPVEIGKALNKEHNPLLGWLYYLSNVLVGIMIFSIILPVGMSVLARNPSKNIPKDDILYRINVDEKVQLDDRSILFDEVIYEKNGDLSIVYRERSTTLMSLGSSASILGYIYDEKGNEYFGGYGTSTGGLFGKAIRTVTGFPKDAEKVIIEYDFYNRYYKVEVPLKAGADHE